MIENELYDYSPIVERPPVRWPGDARVAFYVGLNIEHFYIDRPGASIFEGTASQVPDPLNYGWRDYGARVGIWRQIEALDRHGIRASVLLNSDVCERYPQIIEAGRQRHWAWLGHGTTNATLLADLSTEDERAILTEVVDTIEKATGQRPGGWLGPGVTATFQTPTLLAELGLSYLLDWANDDQPYWTKVPGLLSVPYSIELNDVAIFMTKHHTGADFLQIVKDQLDVLYAESSESGRVLGLALHPYITGQAFRATYLDLALDYVASHPGIWLTTSDEIADHYAAAFPPEGR